MNIQIRVANEVLEATGLMNFEVIPLGPFVNWEFLFATTGRPQEGRT
jgi:hypothetical protein